MVLPWPCCSNGSNFCVSILSTGTGTPTGQEAECSWSRYSGCNGWSSGIRIYMGYFLHTFILTSFIACKQPERPSGWLSVGCMHYHRCQSKRNGLIITGRRVGFQAIVFFSYAVAAAFQHLSDGCRYLNPYPVSTKPMGSALASASR